MALWFLDTVLEFDGAQEPMQEEASYICTSCGEEIVVPIDLSAGESQEYTEDCPVCCHPNVIRIEVSENGDIRAWADRESD
jgi:DNA-directed RNA polymerase subunit RPC12/RpoP